MRNLSFVLILSLAVVFILFLNSFPNFYASWHTPKGYFYSGQASWFDPWDINTYVAAIKWGQKGHLLLNNLYTTDDQKLTLIYTFYTFIGKIFPHFNPFFLFHSFSLIIGLLLCFTIFLWAHALLKNRVQALFSLVLVSAGGGLGWLLGSRFNCADLLITSFTYATAFQRPHESLAIVLYLSSFLFYFLSVLKRRKILNVFSLLAMILLIFFYPFFVVSYAIMAGLFSIFIAGKKKDNYPIFYFVFNMVFIAIVSAAFFFHLKSTGFLSAVPLSIKAYFISVILGYGLLLPFYFYQFFTLKQNEYEKIFLSLWFLISAVLAFLLPFGRFYFRGLFFPLVLICLFTISKMCKRDEIKEVFILFLLTITTSFSSFYIFYQRMNEAGKKNQWFYLQQQAKQAFLFLEARKENGVLAAYTLGNYIPAWTGKKVYFGHWAQTPRAQEKWRKLNDFYSGKYSKKEAEKFLQENKINLVIYGEEERSIGKLKYSFLKNLYKNEKVQIYGINR